MKQKQIDQLSVFERAASPTPKFFRSLRAVGIALAAISSAILAVPVSCPDIVTMLAGYAAVAGGVITAVSQMTVEG